MLRTHKFRVLESTWGVAIDLTAHLENSSESIGDGLVVTFSDAAVAKEHERYAELGIDTVIRAYPDRARCLAGKSLVINAINYAYTDFQDEGIACAVAEWLCEELDIAPCPIRLRFDRSQNRYVLENASDD